MERQKQFSSGFSPAGKMPVYLLLLGVLVCLLHIWLPAYYLTGDGPCHLYNAQVLNDIWHGKQQTLYDRFYTLSYQPNPNWLSSAALAGLLYFMNGVVAEKFFLSVYVLLFVGGGYALMSAIARERTYWVVVILLFVFPHTLAKGFYNYTVSIAFYFWVVWVWIKMLQRATALRSLAFFLFSGLLFFTHLLSFGFAVFTCAALVLSHNAVLPRDERRGGRYMLRYWLLLGTLLLPYLGIMAWFTRSQGGLQMALKPHLYRLIELIQFKYLVSLTHTEEPYAAVTGLVLLAIGIALIAGISRRHAVHKYDGLLLALAAVAIVYLFVPESFLGHLILINMRVQLYIYLLIACCIAYRMPVGVTSYKTAIATTLAMAALAALQLGYLNIASGQTADDRAVLQSIVGANLAIEVGICIAIFAAARFRISYYRLQNVGAFVLLMCFAGMSIERISCQVKASMAVSDYIAVAKQIPDGKTILPLNFAPNGKDRNGAMIADRNFLFGHAADYIAAGKSVIMLDNYEANMGYFPLQWRNNVNPYYHLSIGQGIEHTPPYASLKGYEQQAGVRVDYILLCRFDSSFLANDTFAAFYAEIVRDYHVARTSPLRTATLMERNK